MYECTNGTGVRYVECEDILDGGQFHILVDYHDTGYNTKAIVPYDWLILLM